MLRTLLLFLLLLPALAEAREVEVEGRLFTDRGPFAKAQVSLYRSYRDLEHGTPFYVSQPTDRDGVYRARLPEGSYYFTAKGELDGKEYFAFHGKNPIDLERDKTWISLIANPSGPAPLYGAGATRLTGVATYRGKPVQGAYVAVYEPQTQPFRGLGLRTESVDSEGRFDLAVPPGRYVVIAKLAAGGKGNKPLRKGDLFCYYPSNPVEVKQDQTVSIEIPCYPKEDRASFVAAPVAKPAQFATLPSIAAASQAGLFGRVTDAEGKPVPGMVVLACKNDAPVFMMYHLSHGSPYSAQTDRNGNYFIPIDRDGEYSVVARDTLGDGPHRGEIYGLYQANERHSVSYRRGESVQGVDVVVGKVMEEPLRALPPGEVPAPEALAQSGAARKEVFDRVIDRDTVWEGVVTINGVVSVKRGVTLTIKPGTVVRFSRVDRDRNGIGDGELLVEGRLVARGTREHRITFTSAEQQPQMYDWSYVQLLAADPGSVLEYCNLEYGYAGVMVHYSNLNITDCVFSNNGRGLHFNTANLLVEHSTFAHNKIGIRFMRYEGAITIRNNDIQANELGVLFVKQHVNAVDFGRPAKVKEPPRFVDNNICGNVKYGVSLGDGQDQDVALPGNWWCEPDPAQVAKAIYDGSADSELSRVVYRPLRGRAVVDAGVRD